MNGLALSMTHIPFMKTDSLMRTAATLMPRPRTRTGLLLILILGLLLNPLSEALGIHHFSIIFLAYLYLKDPLKARIKKKPTFHILLSSSTFLNLLLTVWRCYQSATGHLICSWNLHLRTRKI